MSTFNVGVRVGLHDDTRAGLRSVFSGISSLARAAAKPITVPFKIAQSGMGFLRDFNLGLRPAIAGIDHVLTRGAALEVVTKGFETRMKTAGYGTTRLANEIVRAANGTIRLSEAMQIANRAGDNIDFESLKTAVEFISKKSIATGKNAGEALNTVITGLIRGSTLFLDDFGILVDGVDGVKRTYDAIKGSGAFDHLGPAAQKAETIRQAIGEMRTQLSGLGISGKETIFLYEGIKNKIGDMTDGLFLAVAKSKALKDFLTGTRDVLAGIKDHFDKGGDFADLFLGKITDKIKGLRSGNGLLNIAGGFLADVGENIGRGILGGLLKGLAAIPDLFSGMVDWASGLNFDGLKTGLKEIKDELVDMGTKVADAMVEGLSKWFSTFLTDAKGNPTPLGRLLGVDRPDQPGAEVQVPKQQSQYESMFPAKKFPVTRDSFYGVPLKRPRNAGTTTQPAESNTQPVEVSQKIVDVFTAKKFPVTRDSFYGVPLKQSRSAGATTQPVIVAPETPRSAETLGAAEGFFSGFNRVVDVIKLFAGVGNLSDVARPWQPTTEVHRRPAYELDMYMPVPQPILMAIPSLLAETEEQTGWLEKIVRSFNKSAGVVLGGIGWNRGGNAIDSVKQEFPSPNTAVSDKPAVSKFGLSLTGSSEHKKREEISQIDREINAIERGGRGIDSEAARMAAREIEKKRESGKRIMPGDRHREFLRARDLIKKDGGSVDAEARKDAAQQIAEERAAGFQLSQNDRQRIFEEKRQEIIERRRAPLQARRKQLQDELDRSADDRFERNAQRKRGRGILTPEERLEANNEAIKIIERKEDAGLHPSRLEKQSIFRKSRRDAIEHRQRDATGTDDAAKQSADAAKEIKASIMRQETMLTQLVKAANRVATALVGESRDLASGNA